MVGSGVGLTRKEREEIRAVLMLQRKSGLGDRRIAHIITGAGSACEALRGRGIQLDAFESGGEDLELDGWIRDGYLPLPITSPRYPAPLRTLTDPPPVVFIRGALEILDGPAAAIVGSRKATGVGRRMAESLGRVLGARGVTVVSGLALGIDGAAHRGALSVGGPTVAVLGAGIDRPYPASHRGLFNEIGSKGLLLSEFLPGSPALRHHFPKRNRIIAALAPAIVVVEAGERSGALITVDHGLDLGRDIFAVPGSVENPGNRGSNALLAEGAGVVTHPEGLLEQLEAAGLLSAECGSAPVQTNLGSLSVPKDLRPVFAALTTEPTAVEDIAQAAGVGPGEAMSMLTALEMGGWARACPGLRYQAPGYGGDRDSMTPKRTLGPER